MSLDQAYHFKRVSDLISTSGVISEDQLSQLGAEGYGAVINLLPADSKYAVSDEASIVEAQGIIYKYIPVDFAAPAEGDFELFSDALDRLSDTKVMIHCAANYRVSAFYSIYACQSLDWSVGQANEFIASIWSLNEHPVWQEFVLRMLKLRVDASCED